jgi:hypothetical protein
MPLLLHSSALDSGRASLVAVCVSATDAKRTWSNFQLRSIGDDQTDKKAKSV